MFRTRNHFLPPNLRNLFKIKAYDNILFHRIRIITQRKLFNNLTTYLRIKNSIHAYSTNYIKVSLTFYDDN